MPELASLPIELQITLLAGYLAYRVHVTGRGTVHKTEDVVLQVLVFGVLGRLGAGVLKAYLSLVAGPRVRFPPDGDIVLLAFASILCGVSIAALWRKIGHRQFSRVMRSLTIYNDDHEYTTWASIQAASADWTFIQVHLKDGRVFESHFGALPEHPIGGHLTVNDDGIAMYVTRIYPKDRRRKPIDHVIAGSDDDQVVTYIPRSEIGNVEIGWKSRS